MSQNDLYWYKAEDDSWWQLLSGQQAKNHHKGGRYGREGARWLPDGQMKDSELSQIRPDGRERGTGTQSGSGWNGSREGEEEVGSE